MLYVLQYVGKNQFMKFLNLKQNCNKRTCKYKSPI